MIIKATQTKCPNDIDCNLNMEEGEHDDEQKQVLQWHFFARIEVYL